MRALGVAFCFLAVAAGNQVLSAQTLRNGSVSDRLSGTPLAGAEIVPLNGTRVRSDFAGQFRVAAEPGDRLITVLLGYRPDTLIVPTAPAEIVIRLSRVATLEPIVVTTSGLDPAAGGWHLTPDIVRQAPPAVEPDLLRATERLIAVSFSSPFSAQPIIRGVDPGASQVQVDGFPVLNPYHLARAFAAFVPEGVADVHVHAGGMGLESADAVGGTIGVELAEGRRDSLAGGAGLSPATVRGWQSGGTKGAQWGVAGRFVHLGTVINVLPYTMYEGHGALTLGSGDTRLRLTGYGSQDAVRDNSSRAGTGDWSNIVLGARLGHTLGASQIVARTFYSRFVETINKLGNEDADNAFSSGGASVDLRVPFGSFAHTEVAADGAMRRIANRIGGVANPLRSFRQSSFRGGGFVALGLDAPLSISAGVRYDRAGNNDAVEPRIAMHADMGHGLSWSAAVGRYSQFYHLVSDPSGDPDVALYDFWLSAEETDVPVQRATHTLSDFAWQAESGATVRLSAYSLDLSGVMEYQPLTATFRTGLGQSRGLDFEIANVPLAHRQLLLGVAYALAWSDRDWGDGWLPWINDHRHTIRTWGSWRPGERWRINWFATFASPLPTRLVYGTVQIGDFRPFIGQFVRDSAGIQGFNVVTGPEGSGRDWWTGRGDISAEYTFLGIGRSEWSLGFSIVNATIGRIAPAELVFPGGSYRGLVEYRQRYALPPVPTVTLTIRF